MKNKSDKILNLILPFVSLAIILIFWAVSATVIDSEYILPSIGATFKALAELLKSGEFYSALGGTLLRSAIAFLISFAIAFSLAYLTRISKKAERIISPVVSFLRALPTIAVVLLLLFWTTSNVAPIIVTMLVVLPTLYSGLKEAFFSVEDSLIDALLLFKVGRKDMIKKVYVPMIAPQALLLVGAGLSLNVKLMVAAEVLSSTANSLGYLLNTSKVYYEIANMIALVVVTVVIGVGIEGLFRALSKKVGAWKND